MFLKIGRGYFYINATGNIEGIKRDLNAKYLKVDGAFYPMWNIAPTAIRIIEYILNNPNSQVTNICRTLYFSNAQQVNTVLAFLKDASRAHLIYEGPDMHRYSVLKEKEEEIRGFIFKVRNNTMEESDLEEV